MSHSRFMILATIFQGGLLILGLGIVFLFEIPLHYDWSPAATVWGIAGTIPMLLFLWWSLTSNWPPLEQLRELLVQRLGPFISPCSLLDLCYISILAGISEEILFRGALQNSLSGFGPVVAIGVTNLLFGLCHAASPAYFWYAFGAGLYLTAVAGVPEQNLAPAIVTHALYDFVALYVVRERYRIFEQRETQLLSETSGDSPETGENEPSPCENSDNNVKIDSPGRLGETDEV